MKIEKLLILFSKWPGEGNSKSRISKVIGEKKAESFCFACLEDLIRKIMNLRGMDFVVVPDTIKEACLFSNMYGVSSLSLEHLGISSNSISEILYELFSFFLDKYKKISLITMDIPHIDICLIEKSFDKLENHNEVFGPEENGGVYLVGLSKLSKTTFRDVRWSTESSLNDLMRNCKAPATLMGSFDLNTLDDLSNLNKSMLASCPHLTSFIKSLVVERYTYPI